MGGEQQVFESGTQLGVGVALAEPGDELFGDGAESGVGFLGSPGQRFVRPVYGDAVDPHQRTIGLLDHRP